MIKKQNTNLIFWKRNSETNFNNNEEYMIYQKFIIAFLLVFTMNIFSNGQTFEISDRFFKQGKFAEAEKSLPKNSNDFDVLVLRGHLALLANKLDSAQKHLEKAVKLKPNEKMAKQLLAELFYRLNDFQKASTYFREIGRETVAKKLASFAGKKPYQIEDKAEITNIKFVVTDPLPIVTAKINNGEELNFLIDTGGGELIVDTDIAAKNNIIQFGEESGTFGGGRKSSFQHGVIDSFTLGNFQIKNVPINILKTQRFAAALGVKRVDGIVGSILLSRFLTTLDYPNGELVLSRNHKSKSQKSGKSIEVPFWMAGDHFLVAWGGVNKSPQLFFIDTGLAGMGFTAPVSTLKEANIKLANQSVEGVGGGGNMQITPFIAEEIMLGKAIQKNVGGVAGAFPPTLENSLGFRLGGLISHSFFKPYKVTFDFVKMQMTLAED